MGRITDITMEYPDRVLALCGTVGGFTLALASFDVVASAAMGILFGLFTLLIFNLSPNDPTFGPHQ